MSVDPSGRISRFVEKPKVSEIGPGFDLANAAVFVIEKECLDNPGLQDGKNQDFSYDIFERAGPLGFDIYGSDIGYGFRFDVGSVGRLYDLNIAAIRKEILVSVPGMERSPGVWMAEGVSDVGVELRSPVSVGRASWVGEGAIVGPDTIIGNECVIGHSAYVRGSLIMDHCVVGMRAVLDRCIVGPHSRIGANVTLSPFTVVGAFSAIGNNGWPQYTESGYKG